MQCAVVGIHTYTANIIEKLGLYLIVLRGLMVTAVGFYTIESTGSKGPEFKLQSGNLI